MQIQPGLVNPATGQPYTGFYGGAGYGKAPIGFDENGPMYPSPWAEFFGAVLQVAAVSAIAYGFYRGLDFTINLLMHDPVYDRGPLLPREPEAPWPAPRIDYERQYMMLDPVPMYASVVLDYAPDMLPRSRATMTDDEIEAAAKAAFHLGAGWGGLSVVGPPDSTTGRTIDSEGNIFNGDQGPQGHAQFANGQDAITAIANALGFGRGTNTNTPTATPTQEVEEGNND